MANLPSVSTLLLDLQGSTLRVTINRPETRNAMTDEVVADLRPAIREARLHVGAHGQCLGGLLATLLLAGPAAAQLQDVDLRNDVDFSTWTLLGHARTQATPALAFPGGPVVGLMQALVLTDATPDSAGAGFAPKSTFGGSAIAFSLSTVNCGFTLKPNSMAVRLLGKLRASTLYSCTALM